ncbi:hypothetical protein [Crenobacter oryzisoli]|uniref:hypothetical protein n=1 Tax=Crenobacter oryzisoli TaxID=3056844 RepID=UPI003F494107
MVCDPDRTLATDILACEDAHESERAARQAVDRRPSLLHQGAEFSVHEHATSHPAVLHEQPWHEAGRCDTGALQE